MPLTGVAGRGGRGRGCLTGRPGRFLVRRRVVSILWGPGPKIGGRGAAAWGVFVRRPETAFQQVPGRSPAPLKRPCAGPRAEGFFPTLVRSRFRRCRCKGLEVM